MKTIHLNLQPETVAFIATALKQQQRNKTILQLRTGKINLLVATDVAARGIDINDISHVINYDLPNNKECYIHRIGRSGRYGRKGVAINLTINEDFWKIDELVNHYDTRIEELPNNFETQI